MKVIEIYLLDKLEAILHDHYCLEHRDDILY